MFRLDVYVGERDTYGVGFSDNVVFRKQYYVQAFPDDDFALFVHTGEEHLGDAQMTADRLSELAREGSSAPVQAPTQLGPGEWRFDVGGTGFRGSFRMAVTER